MSLRQRLTRVLGHPVGALIALLVLCAAAFAPGQASIPPIDRDEPRFAQAARQMLETGDFIDIRYQDLPRHLQPAGIYWLQSAAVAAFGAPEVREIWPHRLPSLAAAIAIVLLTWRLGAGLFGATAGRFAAALMAVSLLLAAEARIAKIDANLALAALLAQLALSHVYLAAHGARRAAGWGAPLLFWAALGWGVLLKGPIILMVVGLTVGALWALDRRLAWARALRPLWGAPVFLAIALPWYVAIGLVTEGEFYATAVGYSVLGKVADSHQSHGGPFGYHAALFAGAFWPGSLFALLAIPAAWAARLDPRVRFLGAWILPAWLVFEVTGTKLPHYTLPLFPAVAALAGAFLAQALPAAPAAPSGRGAKIAALAALAFAALSAGRFALEEGAGAHAVWIAPVFLAFSGPLAVLAAVVLFGDGAGVRRAIGGYATLLFMAFGFVLVAGLPGVAHAQGAELPLALWPITGAGFVALFVAAALAVARRVRAAAAVAVGTAALTYVGLFGGLLPQLETFTMSPRIVAAVRAEAPCGAQTRLITTPRHEPSLVFLAGGDTLLAKDADAAAAALLADRCALALIGGDREAPFLSAMAAAGVAVEVVAEIAGRNHNEGGAASTLRLYRAQ